MSRNNLNLNRTANEAQTIGNTNPVNMSRVSDSLLAAASPTSFSLLDNTKINKDSSDAAAAKCRSYKDIDGLRKLRQDQINTTNYDAKCGWRYKPSTGLYPEISQGALGTEAGPSFGQPGSPDEVAGGAQWFWNLGQAEKKIAAKICQNASKCKQLTMLGRYADVCGYCKTTGAIIPTVKGAARYPRSTTAGCLTKDIVSAGGACPAEGFTSFRQGNLNEAFTVREGFGSLDDLNNCMEMPLARDCVVKAAQNAGCSPDGTLIQALKSSSGSYDSVLKTNSAYNSYNSFMPFSAGLMKDGSVADISVALDDFGRLMKNTQHPQEKIGLAAKDLCIRAGIFEEYDSCVEMAIDTVINAGNIRCIEKVWKQNGGTSQGTDAPTLAKWNGKRFGDFLASGFARLLQANSDEKRTNVTGLMSIVGTNSSTQSTRPGTDLPMNEDTRGAETVWFDLTNVAQSGAPVVILKCDLRLKKDTSTTAGPAGEVLPFIVTWTEMMNKYNFTNQNNKAYTSAFELRTPPNDTQVIFGITTDDGFMLSKNQNPFENAGKGPDWGSWRYQGPSVYYSPVYNIDPGQTNIFVTKWFQGYGEAAAHFWMYRPPTGWVTGAQSPDVYLTQEPLAPWCQYEICARPNGQAGTGVGFFEKRWNGQSAIDYRGTPTPGFDVASGRVVYQTDPKLRESVPGQKAFASFISSSYWHTNAYFHFNAFRTITILIRPIANLAIGGAGSVFHHCNFRGYSAGMYLKNNGGHYALTYGTSRNQFQAEHFVEMNQWNLIVIQYVGNDYGITKITCNVEPLSKIQSDSGRAALLAKLNAGRSPGPSVVIGNPREEPFPNSGMLIMGAINPTIYSGFNASVPSFTGDVAWVHGFRNYLDSDRVLNNEIIQGWISRWAIPNLPNDLTNSYSYQGCFRDSGDRALPGRLPNVNSVAQCASLAKQAGMKNFGLQYYGECWVGNNSDWDRYGRLSDQGCGALGSAWNNQVYTHDNSTAVPEQNVYGNNGTVTCERYCGGIGGGPWNSELPRDWNGARCVGTPENPGLGCGAGSSSPIVCRCQKTGRGWR
jgi:hypothetical protein